MDDLIENAAFAPTATEIMEQLPKEVDGFICNYILRLRLEEWYIEPSATKTIFNGKYIADIAPDIYIYFKKYYK
jgi:hypothetical protein